ncbi:unnamed protein product, partial [Prorocentrum cordatum]
MAIPSDDDVPWIFTNRSSLTKLKNLLVSMKESKVFQLSKAPPQKGEAPSVSAPPKKKARRGKKAGGGAEVPEVVDGQTVFLQDVHNAVSYTLQGLSEKDIDASVVWEVKAKAVAFGLTGKVEMEKDSMLKKKLVKAHLLADRAHVQADPDGVAAADSLETADSLGSGSAAIASAPEEDMPTGLGPVATVKRMLAIDRKLGARLKAFATAVSGSSGQGATAFKRTHSGLATACTALWNGVSAHMTEVSFAGNVCAYIVEIIDESVMQTAIEREFVEVAALLYKARGEEHAAELSLDAEDIMAIEEFLCMRSIYMVILLDEASICLKEAVKRMQTATEPDLEKIGRILAACPMLENGLKFISENEEEVAAADAKCHNRVRWCDLWQRICSKSDMTEIDGNYKALADAKGDAAALQMLGADLAIELDDAEADAEKLFQAVEARLKQKKSDMVKDILSVAGAATETDPALSDIAAAVDEAMNAGTQVKESSFKPALVHAASAAAAAWESFEFATKATLELTRAWRLEKLLGDACTDLLLVKLAKENRSQVSAASAAAQGKQRLFVNVSDPRIMNMKLALVGKISLTTVAFTVKTVDAYIAGKIGGSFICVTPT